MESSRHLSCESFYYSLRLSFDGESFIEFDPRVMSLRWIINTQEEGDTKSSLDFDASMLPSLSLDSTKSHESHYLHAVSVKSKPKNKDRSAFQNYLWYHLMKICKRMKGIKLAKIIAGNSSVKAASSKDGRRKKVVGVDIAGSSNIQDAVLHCKNSNLSSLVEEECKTQVLS